MSTINPICYKCNVEMNVMKNGVLIAHKETPNNVRSGDIYRCPECNTKMYSNLGEPFFTQCEPEVLFTHGVSEAHAKHRFTEEFMYDPEPNRP